MKHIEFGSNDILVSEIEETNLRAFYIGFDLGACQLTEFTDILMDSLVDFAFGYHTGILRSYKRRTLVEAATALYNIKEFAEVKKTYVDNNAVLDDEELKIEDKFLKRGEFGELILHLILRDYFNTVPLLSKIHFKDTDGMTVHGFDSVHIGADLSNTEETSLYLGESKLYYRKSGKAGAHGIDDLVIDIKSHFCKDFLKRECMLISKKKDAYPTLESYPDINTKEEFADYLNKKNYWIDILNKVSLGNHKMQDFINSVTVPLICTYESELFKKFDDDSHPDFKSEYEKEIKELQRLLDNKLNGIPDEKGELVKSKLNIVLILFPIPSKKELIKVLHQKLYNQQNA